MSELDTIGEFLRTRFNLTGKLTELAGYQDRTLLVCGSDHERYIFKMTGDPGEEDFIRSQNRVLLALAGRASGRVIPLPVADQDGQTILEFDHGDNRYLTRLFKFLEGEFLAESMPDISFYRVLGQTFAQLDKDLEGMEDSVLKCRTHDWDLSRIMESAEDIWLMTNPEDRRLIAYYLMKYREEVLPIQHKFTRSLIHNDGNDWNILLNTKEGIAHCDHSAGVAGIIDFGDMLYGPRVHELAILLAYSLMGRKDYRNVYHEIIDGYREIINLEEFEVSALHWLVAARWCQTLIKAAQRERDNPGNAYHQISVNGAREMLHLWVRQIPSILLKDKSPVGRLERYQYFSRSVSLAYPEPIRMVGSAFQYMYGSDGITYLDCVNNIPHVGHCHPLVVEAGQKQMARLNTNTRYLYDSLDEYATRLLEKFPSKLSKLFLVNSGSAATDLAIRLAETYTGKRNYYVLDYAYHGNTQAAIGISPYKFNRKGGKGKSGQVTILPVADSIESQNPIICEPNPDDRPTFFAESIIGCAGQVMLNRTFLQNTVDFVRNSGGIYIADEVQTGFGRVGQHFWGFELYDVIPDMVILGKPMGNGHPMGAVICSEEIAHSFETGMEFFSSFGGNPVSCAIGLAVLQVLSQEKLQKNAKDVGDFLLMELQKISMNELKSNCILQARGSGLFLGIELRNTDGTPASQTAETVVNSMKSLGFLLSTDGPSNNVIKFKPPMCFSMDNAEELLYNLDFVLRTSK